MIIKDSQELTRILERFTGHKIHLEKESFFKSFSLGFFTRNVIPTFHADIPLDITDIYACYKQHYQCAHSTFNAFLYYHLIQIMKKPEFAYFRYRYINNEWYCFDNPPFFISVTLSSTLQQNGFFIENTANMTWHEFVRAYKTGIDEQRQTTTPTFASDLSWYAIPHQFTSMPFYFTGYTPSQKHDDNNAHAPWVVASARKTEGERTMMTLSYTLSHASSLPIELHAFQAQLEKALKYVPEKHRITHYFKPVENQQTTSSEKQAGATTSSLSMLEMT
jgi:chloramphenicol O-acetyltransferase